MPCRRQKLLCLLDVPFALWDPLRRGREWEDGRPGMVVADGSQAVQETLHQRRTIEAERNRLTDTLIVERCLIDPHVELAIRAARVTEDLDAGVVEESLVTRVRDVGKGVDLASLNGQRGCRIVTVELQLNRVDVR